MSINVLINSEKRVLDFYGTDIQLKTVDTLPEKPEQKIGVDFIPYFDEKENKVIYKEKERPLTAEEQHKKQLEEMQADIKAANERAEKAEKQSKIAKSQALTALQAVGDIAQERPTDTGGESEVM